MRRSLHREKRVWIILLAGLLLLMSACKNEIKEEELGPAITKNQFAESFAEIVETLDPQNINDKQWVFSYQFGYFLGRPLNQDIATQIDVYKTYNANCGDQAGLGLDYFEIQQRKINGKPELFEWDRKACFQNDKIDILWGYYAPILHGSGVISSLHNLKIQLATEKAPKAVVDSGCVVLGSSCDIRVFNIEFFEEILYPDGERERRFHQRKISPDVPFLAKDLLYCITQSLRMDGSMVNVKQCNEVRNFGERSE